MYNESQGETGNGSDHIPEVDGTKKATEPEAPDNFSAGNDGIMDAIPAEDTSGMAAPPGDTTGMATPTEDTTGMAAPPGDGVVNAVMDAEMEYMDSGSAPIDGSSPKKGPGKMLMGILAALVIAMLILASTTGTFNELFNDEEDDEPPIKEEGPFDFNETIPITTFYHYENAVNALDFNETVNLTGDNTPFWTQGTYYGIGTTTFEPTIGVTSTGSLFMTNYGGTGRGTHIIRSQDQGQTWEDMGPWNQAYNSNDPCLYVDPWTDRVVKFDMHALLGMTLEYSDNEGDSWIGPIPVTGESPQDHQTIASTPVPDGYPFPVAYPTIFVYSINTGLQGGGVGGSYGENSFDGGHTWNHPEVPHYEVGKPPASGLSGHLVGSEDGAIYRGQPAQGGPAAYRSLDGGFTWTEHVITDQIGSQSHEVAIGTDEGSNVHAFWIGDDNFPYYSNSQDQGNTWRDPMMVAPPGLEGTGFPTVAGGGDGKVAFSYVGTESHETWNGYLGVITDAFAEKPLITTVAVNDPGDPLDTTPNAGYQRTGGWGDFIDICIDPDGRPWAALANNPAGDIGIVGTFSEGPALRGDLDYLPPLPLGGPDTL